MYADVTLRTKGPRLKANHNLRTQGPRLKASHNLRTKGPRLKANHKICRTLNYVVHMRKTAPAGTNERATIACHVPTAVTIQDFRVPICPSTGRRVIPEYC